MSVIYVVSVRISIINVKAKKFFLKYRPGTLEARVRLVGVQSQSTLQSELQAGLVNYSEHQTSLGYRVRS